MFTSLRAKISALIVLVMTITAAVIMYFTYRDVGRAMLHAEESSAQNVLQLIELNITGGYNRLIADKIEILSRLQNELQHLSTVCVSVLRDYVKLSNEGHLPEAQAQELALHWLKSVRFDKGELFVFDRDGTIIAHPDPEIEGGSILGLRDLKGRPIEKVMSPNVLKQDGDYAVFFWRKPDQAEGGKKMGYFAPISGWHWTLAAIIDFDDIEVESQQKMDAILEVLKKTFAKIRIVNSGYVFLFKGDKHLLIPPALESTKDIKTAEFRHESGALLDRLMSAYQAGETSIRYEDPFSETKQLAEAFISYFKAFDWYLVVVVPVQEIQAPAKALVSRQSLIIGLIFLASVIAIFFLVSRISRPLNTLTSYAKALPLQDFSEDKDANGAIPNLSVKYKDEVGRLAESLVFMEKELRKYIQQVRLEKEAAQRANRAKSEFLATMSHEIRTPMNGVMGMADLVLETPLSSKQRDFVETIRRSGQALLGIINDILDFSKIEAGKLELESEQFNLRHLIEDLAELCAIRIQSKNLELACQLPPVFHETLRGDGGRLRQILTNLVGNAIKFTKSGEVVVQVAVLEETAEDLLLRFQVRDTGIGIAAEHQVKIFDSFTQADNSMTRDYGGTGLGLAISKRLVELMGGTIGVESRLGEGSLFWSILRFPKESPQTPRSEPRLSSQRRNLRGLQILIVDDNPTYREILVSILKSHGMQPASAASEQEALHALHAAATAGRAYPLAILDMHMHREGEGLALALAIKADPALVRTRLLMLSSKESTDERQACREAGVLFYLSKPLRQSKLCESVATAMTLNPNDAPVSAKTIHMASHSGEVDILQGRALLVEDHPVNRAVALEMLKLMGIQAAVACNGREALTRLKEGHYDIVLMDCQMPEMDGYEATAAIRQAEISSGEQRRLPVIALTANALKGDRDRCLAAGMDDYLPKPFNRQQLYEMLARWLPLTTRSAPSESPELMQAHDKEIARMETSSYDRTPLPETLVAGEPPLDSAILEQLCSLDANGGFFSRLIEAFLGKSPEDLQQLRNAVASSDPEAVRKAAHSFKSSSGNLGAPPLAALCKQLEIAGSIGNLSEAGRLLSLIESEYDKVQSALLKKQRDSLCA
jgi:signal transduction histidine kinase/DNA-binding response OmpR family regulator/HPt (histidine-containing phosphotransfer) domain-containing protein